MPARRLAFPFSLMFWFVTSVSVIAAQVVDCRPALEALWVIASNACITGPEGYVCNGGSAPRVQPDGPVGNALAPVGALVELNALTAIHTYGLDPLANVGGLAWLRLPAPVQASMFALGEVALQDVTPPGFPVWQSVIARTSAHPSPCSAAPDNSLIVQSTTGQTTRIVVNGTSLVMNGTVLVRTTERQNAAHTLFVGLAGNTTLLVFGQEYPLQTGEQSSVPYAAGDFSRPIGEPSSTTPFEPALLRALPVELFPRPIILPQPGTVRTPGTVNLRSQPSIYAGLIREVPAGEVMSVLGTDTTGTWYHVRMNTGETGWMLAELLSGNIGPIQAVYDVTPLPPQRFGELGNAGRVLAPAGVNLRVGPDVTFPALGTLNNGTLVTLLERSPYNLWVKVDSNGTVGWLALITLETQAYIDALPIDYNAPPPPTPTRVPGTFGNAFPDPRGGG